MIKYIKLLITVLKEKPSAAKSKIHKHVELFIKNKIIDIVILHTFFVTVIPTVSIFIKYICKINIINKYLILFLVRHEGDYLMWMKLPPN